jgi:hypothetical protein
MILPHRATAERVRREPRYTVRFPADKTQAGGDKYRNIRFFRDRIAH